MRIIQQPSLLKRYLCLFRILKGVCPDCRSIEQEECNTCNPLHNYKDYVFPPSVEVKEHWKRRYLYRCAHGIPLMDDCQECQVTPQPNQ